MAFCGKCGAKIKDGIRFCPNCGEPVRNRQVQNSPQSPVEPGFQQPYQQAQGVPSPPIGPQQSYQHEQYPPVYDEQDIDIMQNKVMAVLAYFGILVLIPIFAAKKSPYARFHANQGLILLISEVGLSILTSVVKNVLYYVSWSLGNTVGGMLSLLNILFLVLSVLGIINAVQGKMQELPVIGSLNILK